MKDVAEELSFQIRYNLMPFAKATVEAIDEECHFETRTKSVQRFCDEL
jgi:hypothetical protein